MYPEGPRELLGPLGDPSNKEEFLQLANQMTLGYPSYYVYCYLLVICFLLQLPWAPVFPWYSLEILEIFVILIIFV